MDKKERKAIIRQKTKWSAIVALLGAIVMVLCVILPYATATEKQLEWIEGHSDNVVFEELNLTAGNIKNVSMVQYARIYHTMSEEFWHNATYGIFYIVLVALIGGGALVAALFVWGRKPIGALLFGGVSYSVFRMLNYDFTDRGVIPSDSYDWGMVHTLFPIAAAILAVGVVWMFVKKMIAKKAMKTSSSIEISDVE